MSVKRWILKPGHCVIGDPEGDWVHHSQYACLLSSHEKLVEALKTMRSDVNRSDYHTRRTAFEKADAALREAEAITKE